MTAHAQARDRFAALATQLDTIPLKRGSGSALVVETTAWECWATSTLSALQDTFGPKSPHLNNFQRVYDDFHGYDFELNHARGIFQAAVSDLGAGYVRNLERQISGELLGDFLSLAKSALAEGHTSVAAVLASAALEDTLKRLAIRESLDVQDAPMTEVVSALKSRGLVSGAQKSLLSVMPKLRDYAMHANWDKLTAPDVASLIGFTEQVLLTHFS